MSSQNGTEQTLPSVHLSSDRRDLGTATAKHEKLDRSDDEQDGRDDDSGWQLDDLQDETYELMPRSDNAYANGSTAPLSDLEGSGKSDISSALAMVKAVVSEDDDPSLPTLTFRVIVLGTVLCAIGAAVSQLFFFKSNAPSFSGFLIILLSYPAGHWMAQVLPKRQYTILERSFTLNPGPFSVKEHVLIAVLAGSGSGAAYGADIIAIMDLYYHQTIGHLGGILLLLSTQMLGFGLSGLMYNLLVRPSKMVWPACLVPISLFNTLHGKDSAITWQRLRFFRLAFLAIFAWQFIPSVIAPILTSFAVLCILSPASSLTTASVLGSGYTGFGLFNLSFDWSVVGSMGGLYVPWSASLNRLIGFMTMCWVIGPLLYFGNFWDALSFDSPIGPGLYTKFFKKFELDSVLDPKTLTLDLSKWEAAKPLLLTPYFALTYGISFATLTAAIVSVLLWHHQDIRDALATRDKSEPDIHVQIMEANYDQVPNSWYTGIGCSMLAAACYVVLFYPMQTPIWGLFLSLVIAAIFLPACGIIAATTGTVIGLNVISEFVAGLVLPGLPIANVTIKCYSYMVMSQALALVSDLKLGLYCKIPPKTMFFAQSAGTALGAVVNYIYVRSVISAKRPYLDGTLKDPTGQWTGRAPRIFYSASVVWGVVSPARFFAGKYRYLIYLGFPLGAILPVIPWYLSKKYPKSKLWKAVSLPLLLDGANMAPQVPTNVLISGLLSAWASQRYALRKHPRWYEKYNFVLSAALDAGTSIQALIVYVFGLGSFFTWWGNPASDSEHCGATSP